MTKRKKMSTPTKILIGAVVVALIYGGFSIKSGYALGFGQLGSRDRVNAYIDAIYPDAVIGSTKPNMGAGGFETFLTTAEGDKISLIGSPRWREIIDGHRVEVTKEESGLGDICQEVAQEYFGEQGSVDCGMMWYYDAPDEGILSVEVIYEAKADEPILTDEEMKAKLYPAAKATEEAMEEIMPIHDLMIGYMHPGFEQDENGQIIRVVILDLSNDADLTEEMVAEQPVREYIQPTPPPEDPEAASEEAKA